MFYRVGFGSVTELIETLWNVNYSVALRQTSKICELIETLWNVNKAALIESPAQKYGINRNIVECKSEWSVWHHLQT